MPSSEEWQMRKLQLTGGAFAAIVGFCDIFTFVRYQTFVATMTGNTILLVRSISIEYLGVTPYDGRRLGTPFPAIHYITIILWFLSGVFIFFLVERKFPRRASAVLGPTFGAAMLLVHSTYLLTHSGPPGDGVRWFHVQALACLFGMVNTMASLGGIGPVTSVTGHLVKIMKGLFTLCSKGWDRKVAGQVALSVSVYIGLISGCIAGILVTKPANTFPVLLPVGPILGLLMWYHDHLRQGYRVLKGWHRKKHNETEDGLPDSEALSEAKESDEDSDEGSDEPSASEEDEDGPPKCRGRRS